jgi:cyclopropane fatty-acyl-phospholipid synthase-like methyltransferase
MGKTLVTDLKTDEDFRNFYEKEYYRHPSKTEIPEDGDFMYGVVLKHLKPYLKPGIKAADVGCNSGNLSLYMAKHGCNVLGIDYARNVIDGARASAEYYRIKNVEFKAMDFVKEWDRTDEFDFVFCCNVLEHVREDREFVEKFYQMLKPGGKLLLIIPTSYSSMYRTFKFFTGRFYSDDEVGHLRRYNRRECRAIVEQTGFIIKKVVYIDSILREWFIVSKWLRPFTMIWKQPFIKRIFNFTDSVMAKLFIYPSEVCIHAYKKEN